MDENRNIVKQRAYHKCNFTICHNEILFKKLKDKPISLQAIGLFWRIMSLPPEKWTLNVKGLAQISGCSTNRVTACLQELQDAGYIILKRQLAKDGKLNGFTYFVFETTNQEFWNTKSEEEIVDTSTQYDEDLLQKDIPYSQNAYMENAYMQKAYMQNGSQYNINIINNNNIKNNKILNNIKDTKTEDKSSVTSEMKILKNNNITKTTTTKDLDEKTENLINLRSAKGSLFPSKGSDIPKHLSAKEKAELRRQERAAKHEQERQANNSIRTVDTQGYQVIGDLTDEDNENAQALRTVKELTALGKQVNKLNYNKLTRRKQIVKKLQQRNMDPELIQDLSNFVDVYMDTKGLLAQATLDAKIDDLKVCTNNDVTLMKAVVKTAIKKGWLDFYLTEDMKNEVYTNKDKQELLQTTPNLDVVLDENGKPLEF